MNLEEIRIKFSNINILINKFNLNLAYVSFEDNHKIKIYSDHKIPNPYVMVYKFGKAFYLTETYGISNKLIFDLKRDFDYGY